DHLHDALSRAGFLEDENFASCKEQAERAFREAPDRQPVHAGAGYPDDSAELSKTLSEYMTPAEGDPGAVSGPVVGIAAPHVTPFGGIDAYRAACRCLKPEDSERTFIVLGTSHYGEPNRLGLTRKPFVTPFGKTSTDTALVDEILSESGDGARMEDY